MAHKIKAKAIQMINRQQDEKREAMMNYESEFGATSERSSSSMRDQADAQAWLQKLKTQSEEIFYR